MKSHLLTSSKGTRSLDTGIATRSSRSGSLWTNSGSIEIIVGTRACSGFAHSSISARRLIADRDGHVIANLARNRLHDCNGDLTAGLLLWDHPTISVGFVLDYGLLDGNGDSFRDGSVSAILALNSDAFGFVELTCPPEFLVGPRDIFLFSLHLGFADISLVGETFLAGNRFTLGSGEGPVRHLPFDPAIRDGDRFAVLVHPDGTSQICVCVTFSIPNGVAFLLIVHAAILVLHAAAFLGHLAGTNVRSTKARIRVVSIEVWSRKARVGIIIEVVIVVGTRKAGIRIIIGSGVDGTL